MPKERNVELATTMHGKNVLLMDDHPVLRSGLKRLLNDWYSGLNVYEASDGDAMLRSMKQRTYDLLVVDVQVPNTDAIRMVELVSIRYPQTGILAFTMMPEDVYGKRMLQAGAQGFLPKTSPLDEIHRAFDLALRRKKYVSQQLLEWLTDDSLQARSPNPFTRLSSREFEIVNLLIAGQSITEIAKALHIKPTTVGTYKARIFEKTAVTNVFQLKDLAKVYNLDGMIPE